MDAIWEVANACARELTLFAAVGFLVGGLDDLLIDLIWIVRTVWRRAFVYRRHVRSDAASIGCRNTTGRMAIFIPAWDESTVIDAMLGHALSALPNAGVRIYVGGYRNDPATLALVRRFEDDRVRLVVVARPGPTTKADCLNALWQAMCDDEARDGRFDAVVLHDAEDVIHSAELPVFTAMIGRFDFVQLPVLPILDAGSRWIAGHYADEFAEAHAKTIVVREALGAGIPAAGVGCAIARDMLARVAAMRGGVPFDEDSLTEDYELGLRIAELGGRGAFVRLPVRSNGPAVAIRAHFPGTLADAVRQKSRWIAGIALHGWDRLGWRGGVAEAWMRLHDRRALIAAVVLVAAYAALVLNGMIFLWGAVSGRDGWMLGDGLAALLLVNLGLLIWRLAMRFGFVTLSYGWREGLRAVPRAIVGNIVAIMAARRAVGVYLRMRRDGVVRWDKTAHQFPRVVPAE